MPVTAAEQYLIELINRARLDPLGEVARAGVDLNAGLAPGTLDGGVRAPLAPNALLAAAADGHSQWMLDTDTFSHTGAGGSMPWDRTADQGYDGNGVGENISWRGSTGSINGDTLIGLQHTDLIISAHHRVNILSYSWNEIGVGQQLGRFQSGNYDFNASMVTENFGRTPGKVYVTGVAYTDTNGDRFYSVGEGRSGVSLTVEGVTTQTATAGGYALDYTAASDRVTVTGQAGTTAFSVVLDASALNIKLDVVSGTTLASSASLWLGTGMNAAFLLGAGDLNATGNAAANALTGNKGANVLQGLAGNDTIAGGEGADILRGGLGADRLQGDAGNDQLFGDLGNDTLGGGDGADRLAGGAGADLLTGGLGADVFLFGTGGGRDRVTDLTLAQGDHLRLDNALWGNGVLTAAQVVSQFATDTGADVVLSFADGTVITLAGLASVTGLAAAIEIY